MDRRLFLKNSSAVAGLGLLTGCTRRIVPAASQGAPALPFYDLPRPIVPIRADVDRLFRITVCTRPFRAAGPRIETERVGDKVIVHNYGHGGSGWSLSWGSAAVALEKTLAALEGHREVAVVGCGVIGMTSAITAQRAGLKVTIYAKERAPYVRSSRATGSWTPDSRVALDGSTAADFPALWERMARTSFGMHQSYLGAPGTPVEWTDWYTLEDPPEPKTGSMKSGSTSEPEKHPFASYHRSIADLTPRRTEIDAKLSPFPAERVWINSSVTFNIADYSRQMMNDFLLAGGVIETREFHSPAEIAALPQRVVMNCTGYAARRLWSDESVVPVRGQIGWLIPQEDARYGLLYKDLIVLSRRDGIVIQTNPQGDDTGWNDDREQPDRAMSEAGVRELQTLYARMPAKRA